MIKRAERLAKEIRHAVGDLLVRSAPEECNGAMLTVSHVELTKDLKEARIFVSVYPPLWSRTREKFALRSGIK